MNMIKKFLLLIILISPVLADVKPAIISFNAGELSPLMRARSDFAKYDNACSTLQNTLVLSQGPAFRRPGLKYIASSPGPYPELICDYTSPTISSEPSDTALSGETEITDETGLAAIAAGGHYALMNDIYVASAWTPIKNFSGVLEGNGFTISNLTVSAAGTDKQGMFRYIGKGAEIRNLTFKECSITGDDRVGVLIGDANNTSAVVIKNVAVIDSTITGVTSVAGLIGQAHDVNDFQVVRCTGTNNTITASGGFAGGLLGYVTHDSGDDGPIKVLNCSSVGGTVTETAAGYAGGLIAHLWGQATDARWAEIHSCMSSTSVTGEGSGVEYFGGLIGNTKYSAISDCYSTGTVSDNSNDNELWGVGGFAGIIGPDANAVNCYSTGDVTLEGGGSGHIGGFVGKCDSDNSEIIHCYSTGDLILYTDTASAHQGRIGGFIGWVSSQTVGDYGIIQQCWSLGNIWLEYGINSATRNGVGGFIGAGSSPTYGPDIDNCYTKSSIVVDDDKVGFYGGGFIGEFQTSAGDDWDVNDCYAQNTLPSGAVVSGGLLGGFVGKDNDSTYDVNCTNCFWDKETSGITADDSTTATGLDTAAMQLEASFTTWDFTDIWLIPDTEKRLLPFEYSVDDVYILEFGHKYMRVFRDSGQVLNSTTDLPVQIQTPFEGSELFDIQYVQLADTMYLVEPNDPPQVLTRSSHSDWNMENIDIWDGPFTDENVTTTTITPSSVDGVVTLTASKALWTADHIGSLWRIGHQRESSEVAGTLTANGSSNTIEIFGEYSYNQQGRYEGTVALERSFDDGTNWETVVSRYNKSSSLNEVYNDTETEDGVLYRVTLSGYVSGTVTYNLVVYERVQYGVVRIDDFISTTVVKGTVLSTLAGTAATEKWQEGYWSDENGWPRTIEFHEFRLWYGGSEVYPQTIWTSRTDDFNDMTIGTTDTHALIYTLPSQNVMQWMKSEDYLFMGTLGGVGRFGEKDEAMAPTVQPVYREQSPHGSAYMQAVLAGDSLIYVERTKRKVREFIYSLEKDRFVSPDLTILAEHITGDGIVDYAYQKRPDPTLWYIRDDGNFLSMTYNKLEHNVVGWSDHVTDGNALSVAVIPSDNEDEVWFVIERTIDSNDVKYIEQMQPRDWGADQEDCFYVDSGLTYDGAAATTFSGFDHIEGETATILADGLVVASKTISSGGFTLTTAASVVHAGLPYTTIIETMPVVFAGQKGSVAADNKQIGILAMNYYESLGTLYGVEDDTDEVFTTATTSLYSGWRRMSFDYGFRTPDMTIYLEQVDPLPLTLRALIPAVTVMD